MEKDPSSLNTSIVAISTSTDGSKQPELLYDMRALFAVRDKAGKAINDQRAASYKDARRIFKQFLKNELIPYCKIVNPKPVTLFISYAWAIEKSATYQTDRFYEVCVEKLARDLKESCGIKVYLDRWYDKAGKPITDFLEEAFEQSDYFLVVGTKLYLEKYKKRAQFEKDPEHIVRAEGIILNYLATYNSYKRSSIIPILLESSLEETLPPLLRPNPPANFKDRDYFESFFYLISSLYNLDPDDKKFKKLKQSFYKKLQENEILASNEGKIEVPIRKETQKDSDVNQNILQKVAIKNSKQEQKPEDVQTSMDMQIKFKNKHELEIFSELEGEKKLLNEKLQKIYTDKQFSHIERLFDDKLVPIGDYYVKLNIIEEQEQKEKEKNLKANSKEVKENTSKNKESLEFFKATAFPTSENLLASKNLIELPSIFETVEKKQKEMNMLSTTARILIFGLAGMGKTTLCQYIAYQWASKNKLWKERYDFVFRIPLRNLTKERYFEPDESEMLFKVIHRECFNDNLDELLGKQLKFVLKNHQDRVLILLDGYDETPILEKGLKRCLEQLKSFPYVVITSRPQMVEKFATDLKLEISGLNDENINEYIEKFFKKNSQKGKELKDWLAVQPVAKSLVRIPINLEIVCSAWVDENFSKFSEISSVTWLYQVLVHWLFKRSLSRYQGIEIRTFQDLTFQEIEEKYCNSLIKTLENISWHFMEASVYQIDVTTLKQWLEQDKLEIARQSGFVRKATGSNNYYFSHPTFQEFFAAKYIVRCLKTGNQFTHSNYKTVHEFFIGNKFNPRWQMVWQFVAGLLADDKVSLKSFLTLLNEQPHDWLRINELSLVMECIEQLDYVTNKDIAENIFREVEKAYLKVFSEKVLYKPYKLIQSLKLSSQTALLVAVQLGEKHHPFEFCIAIQCLDYIPTAYADRFSDSLIKLITQNKGNDISKAALVAFFKISKQISSKQAQKVIPILLTALKSKEAEVPWLVLAALKEFYSKLSPQQVDEIITSLSHILQDCYSIHARSAALELSSAFYNLLSSSELDKLILVFIKLLQDKNPDVRWNAAQAIQYFSPSTLNNDVKRLEKLISALFVMVSSTPLYSSGIATSATYALFAQFSEKLPETIFELWLTALKQKCVELNDVALRILPYIHKCFSQTQIEKTIATLMNALKSNDRYKKIAVWEALKYFSKQISEERMNEIIEILLTDLRSNKIDFQKAALEKVKEFFFYTVGLKKEVIATFLTTLKKSDNEIKWWLLDILREIASDIPEEQLGEVIEVLLTMLQEPNRDVRSTTLRALKPLFDRASPEQNDKAVIVLLGYLKNSSKYEKIEIWSALEQINSKISDHCLNKVVQTLINTLKNSNEEKEIIIVSIEVLKEFFGNMLTELRSETIDILIQHLKMRDTEIQWAIFNLFKEISSIYFPSDNETKEIQSILAKAIQSGDIDLQLIAFESWKKMFDEIPVIELHKFVSNLNTHLKSDNQLLKEKALSTLSQTASYLNEQNFNVLIPTLISLWKEDKNSQVKALETIQKILNYVSEKQFNTILSALFEQFRKDSYPYPLTFYIFEILRQNFKTVLTLIPFEGVLIILIHVFDSGSPIDKWKAQNILDKLVLLDSPNSLKKLIECCRPNFISALKSIFAYLFLRPSISIIHSENKLEWFSPENNEKHLIELTSEEYKFCEQAMQQLLVKPFNFETDSLGATKSDSPQLSVVPKKTTAPSKLSFFSSFSPNISSSDDNNNNQEMNSKVKESAPQTVSESLKSDLPRKGLSDKGSWNNQDWIKIFPTDESWIFGQAVDNGDCFYDAIAQSVNSILNSNNSYTVKSLRQLCSDKIRELNQESPQNNWIKQAIEKDKGPDDYQAHLATVQYTQEEMEKFKKESNVFTGYAIRGKLHIEGRILAGQLNLVLHVIEFHEVEDSREKLLPAHIIVRKEEVEQVEEKVINYQHERMIHLAVYRNHFVPVLPSWYLTKDLLGQIKDGKREVTQFNEHTHK